MKGSIFPTTRTLILLISLIISASRFLYPGVVPKSEKEVPLPAGSNRDPEKETASRSQMGWENNPAVRTAVLKVYKTKISPEDAFNFYLQKIGGEEGSMDFDPAELKPGSASIVKYEAECYTDDDFTDYEDQGGEHSGKWRKQMLAGNRKGLKSGKWLKAARFNWFYREKNNDITTLYVIISDEGFDATPGKYETLTSIEIQSTTEKSGEAMSRESDAQMDRQIAETAKSLRSKPPTPKDLGVPVYPGARFDADATAGMSAGNDYMMYIYLAADGSSKVVEFYEKQLKKKAVQPAEGKYMISLKGNSPIPEEGISIEPNTMFPGSAKTVITILKKVGK
jgi:hypothetical protein